MSSIKDTLGDRPFSAPAKNSLPWLAAQINLENQAAGSALARGLDHALKCGELLNTAKRRVRHGEWGDWLAENCPDVSERSAQVYMRLADHIDLIKAKSAALRFPELSLRAATKLISATPATAAPVEPEPQSGFAHTSASQRAAAPLVPSAGSGMPDLPRELDRRVGDQDVAQQLEAAEKNNAVGTPTAPVLTGKQIDRAAVVEPAEQRGDNQAEPDQQPRQAVPGQGSAFNEMCHDLVRIVAARTRKLSPAERTIVAKRILQVLGVNRHDLIREP